MQQSGFHSFVLFHLLSSFYHSSTGLDSLHELLLLVLLLVVAVRVAVRYLSYFRDISYCYWYLYAAVLI